MPNYSLKKPEINFGLFLSTSTTFMKNCKIYCVLQTISKKQTIMRFTAVLSAFLLIIGCNNAPSQTDKQKGIATLPAVQTQAENGIHKAYFASGCFWCVEAVYESVKGVEESISGYSGGHTENPTYNSSNTGTTGHAEAVEIHYNPEIISFAQLVDVYFGSQNVTQKYGQGPDRGSQYRSILFYQNDNEKRIIAEKIKEQEAIYGEGKVAAEVLPFQVFWKGEGYHQDYEARNPSNPYIRNVSIPRLRRFQQKFPELLKQNAH